MTQILENNEILRQSVIDADELHRRIHFSSSISSSSSSNNSSSCTKRRTESSRLATKVLEQLAEFEKNVTFSSSSSSTSSNPIRRFSNDKFFADTKLSVPIANLTDPSQTANPDGLLNLQKAVLRLAQVQSALAKKQGEDPEKMGASSFYATHRFLNQRAPEIISKCLDLHRQAPLQSQVWTGIPDALLVLLDDIVCFRTTEEILTQSEEARKRLAFDVEELTHQQTEAIGDGDMKAAEQLYFKKVAVQESMVPLFDQMNTILDEHQQGCVMEPATRAQDILQRANGDISVIASKNEERKKSLQGDLKALMGAQKLLTDEDRELRQRFVRLRTDSDAYLKENLSEMEKCYNAMEELERHVARLAAERSDAMQRRIAADIQEAQRVADLENFFSFTKQHKLLLDTSLRTVDASDEVTDLFHELVSSGSNAVSQRIKAIETDVETMRATLHEQRLAQFRNLYLTLGDLQYKKERNLEELDKKIEQVHIQQEIAMDTFNPKAKQLADAKKELIAIREEMQGQIGVIHDKAQLQIEYFRPTEEALIQSGKEFVHPVDELDQRNEQRQIKMLEYHTLMRQQAQEEEETGGVGVGTNAEDEKKKIEELKGRVTSGRYHSASARKIGGGAGTPTSPNHYQSGVSSNHSSPDKATAALD